MYIKEPCTQWCSCSEKFILQLPSCNKLQVCSVCPWMEGLRYFLSILNIPSLYFLLSSCLAALFSPTGSTNRNFKIILMWILIKQWFSKRGPRASSISITRTHSRLTESELRVWSPKIGVLWSLKGDSHIPQTSLGINAIKWLNETRGKVVFSPFVHSQLLYL